MEGLKIFKRPRLKNPVMIVAWPGMGEVASRAAGYLVEKLKAEPFAEIISADFFYLVESAVQDGIMQLPRLPANKFYFVKSKGGANDLIILVSEAQPDLALAQEYSRLVLHVAAAWKVRTIVGFAAMPQAIDHTQQPQVWFAATSPKIAQHLKTFGLQVFADGHISGLNGLFLGLAKEAGFDGFCLLGEIPLYTIQIENPKASAAVLDALNRVLNLSVDLSVLAEQSKAMEEQINGLLDYLKVGQQPGAGSSAPGPIGEEEIEKIKKSLSQLTKLPLSVKEKIEALFAQAQSDLSRANELKAMLDTWNVYKDYEDRFLDLFRRTKMDNN